MKKIFLIFLLFPALVQLSGQAGNTKRLEDLEQNQSVGVDSTTATVTKSTRLFGAKDDLTTVLVIIPAGSVVNVLDSDSTYLHVSFDENEGYIFRKHATINQVNDQSGYRQNQNQQNQSQYNQQNQYDQQNRNQYDQQNQQNQYDQQNRNQYDQQNQQNQYNQQNQLQNRQRQEYQQNRQGSQDQYQQSQNELQNRQRREYQQSQQNNQGQYQQDQQNGQDQQGSRFSYLENKYGTNMASRMMAGKIWKGMTPEMVRDTWGKAMKINRVINGNTIKEEWIYQNTWLYFENNELVQWGPAKR